MRVLVCGGRDYNDRGAAFAALDRVHVKRGIACVIEGGARGGDRLGAEWAELHGVAHIRCPADWARNGRAAGFLRNRSMLVTHKPDLVVALPGGRGTAHMVELARASGVTVWEPVKPG